MSKTTTQFAADFVDSLIAHGATVTSSATLKTEIAASLTEWLGGGDAISADLAYRLTAALSLVNAETVSRLDWLTGTSAGGPNGDGYYQSLAPDGTQFSFPCLAKIVEATAKGDPGGVNFTFSTTTTDADPGNGKIRFNNATIGSVTQIYADNLEGSGASSTAWLDIFDDVQGSVRGLLHVREVTSEKFAIFSITGDVVAGSGYRKIPVTYVSGPGGFTNSGRVALIFIPKGEKGSGILSGSGAPSNSLGNNGDIYLNLATGDFYGPKASGTWGTAIVATGLNSLLTDTIAARVAAQAAQTAAAASASAAASSATAAATSKTGADTAAATATTKAAEALTSETNAASSATSSAGSATAADTAKVAAQTAKTAAETARDAAAGSASSADTSKTAAQTAKTAAETARDAAAGSASAAATSKTGADSAKAAAETARDAAAGSASAAATSKTGADSAKAAAESARDAAAGSASDAATSKTGADTAAATATTKAGEASTSATSAAAAKTAAEAAQAAAEAARDDAEAIVAGDFVPSSQKGVANGVASLDSSGKVPSAQLSLTKSQVGLGEVDNTADTAKPVSTAQAAEFAALASAFAAAIAALTKASVGLGSVDNTSDTAKPVSTAQAAAIAAAIAALTKASVGLGSVDNTSDADKPVSTAQAAAIAAAGGVPAFTDSNTATPALAVGKAYRFRARATGATLPVSPGLGGAPIMIADGTGAAVASPHTINPNGAEVIWISGVSYTALSLNTNYAVFWLVPITGGWELRR